MDRSRQAALELIQQLREQLVQQPERFAELAALHSEDVATRVLGGSLGGIQAYQLRPWAEVLDALAQTPAGTISEVIETAYGFHVFQRRRPPVDATVSGARLVVGHEEARWLAYNARGNVPSRTRAEALALANDLYAQANANSEEFAGLVDRYSDHSDAARSGDMGTWSTTEVTPYPREVELLSRLAVGEVAPPIDSPMGFEIVRRMPNQRREWYGIEQVSLAFDPPLPGQESPTMPATLARMREFSKQIQKRPTRFAELQREQCCTEATYWQDGRGPALLTDVLSHIGVGEIATEPVRFGASYVLVRRIEPVISQAPRVAFELPEPILPIIEPFIASHSGDAIASVLGGAVEEARASFGPATEIVAKISRLQGDLGRFAQLERSEDRLGAYRATLAELSAVLGPRDYTRYEHLLNAHWEQRILQGR